MPTVEQLDGLWESELYGNPEIFSNFGKNTRYSRISKINVILQTINENLIIKINE